MKKVESEGGWGRRVEGHAEGRERCKTSEVGGKAAEVGKGSRQSR